MASASVRLASYGIFFLEKMTYFVTRIANLVLLYGLRDF